MDYNALQQRRDVAARRIQAAWRAYRGRLNFQRLRSAAGRIQAVAKGWYVRKQVQEQRDRQRLDERFQAVKEKRRERMRILEQEKTALMALPGRELEEWEQRRLLAAVRVQAAWRGLVARRRMAASPERHHREQAARRIQSTFRRILAARSTATALSAAAAAASGGLTSSTAAAAFCFPGVTSGSPGSSPPPPHQRSPHHQQQQQLRQSGASVLMGSPQLRGSPASAGPSPQTQQQQGRRQVHGHQVDRQGLSGGAVGEGGARWSRGMEAEGEGGTGATYTRGSDVMGPKRYKELQAQVEGKLAAYVAMAKARGVGRRPDPRVGEVRLEQLLRQHKASASERLGAAAERQRSLVLTDTLCVQLEQLRPLSELPPDAAPSDFPRPARGSQRAQAAAQAHALQLAEARVGSSWWRHLRGLNTQAVQDAMLAEEEERWEVADARWRRRWHEQEEQENRRPDAVDELRCRTGAGAAAVAAARTAAALAAKQEEYAARVEAAATGGHSTVAEVTAPTSTASDAP